MKLVFATLFHEYPRSARQLATSILRQHPGSELYYAIDPSVGNPWTGLGRELERLRRERRDYCIKYPFSTLMPSGKQVHRITPRRQYSWKNLQRFIFDVVEVMDNTSAYDYLAFIDSDAMITGRGLCQLIDTLQPFDFSVTADDPSTYMTWTNGKKFHETLWPDYKIVTEGFGLTPRMHSLGTMMGLFLLSRKAAFKLSSVLERLESHPIYLEWEAGDPEFPFWEAFLPQLLGDMGLVSVNVRDHCPAYRVRPFWRPSAYDRAKWFYHPVHRHPRDPFRQMLRKTQQ